MHNIHNCGRFLKEVSELLNSLEHNYTFISNFFTAI